MTAPPAVAEPPVGSQEYIVAVVGGGGWREVADRDRLTESVCDALSPMSNNRGGGSADKHQLLKCFILDNYLFNSA